jgi:signal transduction histidine kinase/ligand-binding sensor domain-containing protein/CheY-like chemotaxis protein/AraC-like DNA-binding protein
MRKGVFFVLVNTILGASLVLPFSALYGNSPIIKHFTSDQGLVSNKVHCIAQDSSGFMWIGTENGLSRFDGYSFLSFSLASGDSVAFPSDNILCMAVDPKTKFLWIGTTKGLCYFNHFTFDFHRDFNMPPGDSNLAKGEIRSLFFDRSGKLWASTPSGVYYFNVPGEAPMAINTAHFEGLPNNDVYCVYEDSKGSIWIGSRRGLNIYDPKANKILHVNELHSISGLYAIFEDSEHNMWFSTQSEGLYQYSHSGQLIHYSKENKRLSSNFCTSTIEDEDGNILASVRDGKGLHISKKGTAFFDIIEPDIYDINSLKSTTLSSMYKDNFGNIWIGSWNGINFIDKKYKRFNHYKINYRADGMISNSVRSFYQDSDGDIWIGTRDGGCLSKFDPGSGAFVNYKHNPKDPQSLSDTYVLTICEVQKGIFLIGTFNGGLNIFNKYTGKFERHSTLFDDRLNSGAVFKIFKDRMGTIWVALSNELYTFDLQSKKFTLIPYPFEIRDFLDYDENSLYMVSASKGVYRHDYITGETKTADIHKTGFPSNTLTSINMDSQKNVWITSYDKGLIKWHPKNNSIKTYQVKHGLANNLATAVLIDNSGNLWVSTSNGISRFDTLNMKFKKYDVLDGLQGNEFEKGVACKLKTGEMLFGGINGFNYFHPDSITDNPFPPRVVITDFRLFNEKVAIARSGSPLANHISETKEIVLTHNQSVITFEFTAINYSTPEKNQYAYKLENFDKNWNYVGTSRTANYTTLPPGGYVFKVIASNNDGVWNSRGVALNVTILPPWWATWWFRALVVFVFAGIIIGYYRYRIKSLLHQKQLLALKVKERTYALENANKELGDQKEQILEQNQVLFDQTEELKSINSILHEKNKLIEGQNDEILLQRDKLMDLNEKIKQANQYKLQFFTNISHEFRTPLTLILGPIEKILSDWEPVEEIKNYLILIKKNSQRLRNLINELMDFRTIESKKAELKPLKGDIAKFVGDIAENFEDLAKHQKIKLTIINTHLPIETCFDFKKMEKILYNLISNAFKYTKPNGLIEIEVSRNNGMHQTPDNLTSVTYGKLSPGLPYVEISVKDTGIGIEGSQLAEIFNRFARLKSAEFVQGAGIGLALTKNLVEIHRGSISVSSKLGKGSVFTVKIPLIEDCGIFPENGTLYNLNYVKDQMDQLTDNLLIPDHEPVVAQSPKNEGLPKILVVEDNKDLRQFISKNFSDNYEVIEASNGNDGLKMAQTHVPELIVSDVLMPGMSGIDMCKRIKTDLYTCHIPVILLTALAEVENQMIGLESRADDYIPKPFEPAILELKVRNLIESRQRLRSMYTASEDPNISEITTNSRDEQFLQKAMDIVLENILNSDFSITDFTEKMCVSRSLLHKKLVSLTGHSATDFIVSIRLKKSLQLLKNKDLTVSEISYMVGFNTPKYFSRCFKRYYGKNPTQYYDET